jgi:hypothetical protein
VYGRGTMNHTPYTIQHPLIHPTPYNTHSYTLHRTTPTHTPYTLQHPLIHLTPYITHSYTLHHSAPTHTPYTIQHSLIHPAAPTHTPYNTYAYTIHHLLTQHPLKRAIRSIHSLYTHAIKIHSLNANTEYSGLAVGRVIGISSECKVGGLQVQPA